MAQPSGLTRVRIPLVTLLLCGTAVVVQLIAPLKNLLIFDRQAIEHGELWRLVSGSIAHHSGPHLIWNLLAVGIVGVLIERRRIAHFAALCFAAAAAVGIAIYLLEPDLRFYAGLSGVAVAAIVYLCLDGTREPGTWRWLCVATLSIVTLKLAFELHRGASALGSLSTSGYELTPMSHVAGVVAATLTTAIGWAASRRRFSPESR